MNTKQTNYYRMDIAVQSLLDQNPEKWNGLPVLVQIKNNFDELILRINAQNEKAGTISTAITKNKTLLRDQLVRKCLIISGAMHAYAAMNGNQGLIDQNSLTKSELENSRETELENKVQPVIDGARTNMEALAEYGINEELVNELETTVDEFTNLIGKPRIIRNQKYAAINQIDELSNEALNLLNNKLDKLMIRFQFTDPEFYDNYKRARTIVDM